MLGPTTLFEKSIEVIANITQAFVFAKFGADDNTMAVASAATDNLMGIFQHTVTLPSGYTRAEVRIQQLGISDLKLGGTVTRGDRLTPNASGYGITATSGQSVGAVACASGVSGDIIPVFVLPQVWAPNMGADGLSLCGIARATYDFSEHGGAIEAIGLGVTIPDNAIITRGYFEVITQFVSTDNTGTIALHVQSANDLFNAADPDQLSAGSVNELIPDGTAAAMIKLTAAREITLTIASKTFTAGKATFFVEYVLGG